MRGWRTYLSNIAKWTETNTTRLMVHVRQQYQNRRQIDHRLVLSNLSRLTVSTRPSDSCHYDFVELQESGVNHLDYERLRNQTIWQNTRGLKRSRLATILGSSLSLLAMEAAPPTSLTYTRELHPLWSSGVARCSFVEILGLTTLSRLTNLRNVDQTCVFLTIARHVELDCLLYARLCPMRRLSLMYSTATKW